MGLIFGWWFQRTRRVLPLVIAHFLIDAISFIGYVYLHRPHQLDLSRRIPVRTAAATWQAERL